MFYAENADIIVATPHHAQCHSTPQAEAVQEQHTLEHIHLLLHMLDCCIIKTTYKACIALFLNIAIFGGIVLESLGRKDTYELIVERIRNAGEEHCEIVEQLLGNSSNIKHSFISLFQRASSGKFCSANDISSYKLFTETVAEYIRRYHAPASTKQALYQKIYALCESIGKEYYLSDYKLYLEDLPAPAEADITVALIKALHNREGISKMEFAAQYEVDPRTIQNRIQALSGNPKHKPLRIGGFAVNVPVEHVKKRESRDETQRYYTPNTLNPLVLQLNTIQVATLLHSFYYNNLKKNIIPMDMAIDVWSQLSDYTKNRIRDVFCQKDQGFANFIDDIDAEAVDISYHFMEESEWLFERDSSFGEQLLIAFKNGTVCDISLTMPVRSRSCQRIYYDFDREMYYAVPADGPDDDRLYFTEDELNNLTELR